MHIPRIDDAFRKCEAHLSSETVDSEIIDLLTRSLLILICAEFERKIKEMVKEKCESIPDDDVRKFVHHSANKAFRGLKITDLAGLLDDFSSEYKRQFNSNLDEKTKNMYSSILTNRNAVAHGGENAATFQEVKRYYEQTHVVLDWFQKAISG